MNEAEKDTPGLVRLSDGLGPVSEAKARAFAQALRGMADGFDQWRWWSRPDPLVMNTLRRAADELDKAGDAAAAERERCATMCENAAARFTAEGMPISGPFFNLAKQMRGPNVGIEPPRSGRLE